MRRAVQVLCSLGIAGGIATMGVGIVGRSRALAVEDKRSGPAPVAVASGMTTVDRPDLPAVPVAACEVDALEVSVAEYDACVRAGACTLYASAGAPGVRLEIRHRASELCRGGRPHAADQAMNCVDFEDAEAYCKWVGKRLPTREEWWQAIGAKHREQASTLHRRATPELSEEWTSSLVQRRTPPPGTEMRWVGTWAHYDDTSNENHLKARMGVARDSFRWPNRGFRCAR